ERIAQMESNPQQLARCEARSASWRDDVRRMIPHEYFVRHYDNHAAVSGDLDMDRLPGNDIAGVVVDGDLELNGSILNWEIDTSAAFLWVRGSLHCHNIVFGCMDMVVDDNVSAAGLVVVSYNHGHLWVGRDIDAKRLIIDSDGSPYVGGRVFAKGWKT